MASSQRLALHGDVAVIHCSGPIVAGGFGELRATALAAIQQTGKVVLDLTDTTFIDSMGLGLLAFLCVSARRRSGDLKLAGPNAQISEVLEETMLGRVFEIYPTPHAAEAAFRTAVGS